MLKLYSDIKGRANSLPHLITGVVVNYNTPELLRTAIASVRQFYDFPIIVIDGSDKPEALDFVNVEVKEVGYNIGHGLGMDMGIKMAKTGYILTFDTDIEMKKPCIELMLKEAKKDTYAIGKLYLRLSDGGVVRIIDPAFQLLSKDEYLKYAPYISDGSPTVLSYHDLAQKKKDIEALINFSVFDYVDHRRAGTRNRIEMSEYEHPDNLHWKEKWVEYAIN